MFPSLRITYTGVDGEKRFSVSVDLLKKSWRKSQREGRYVYVIPADRSVVIFEETEVTSLTDLKKFISLEVEAKFGEVVWDVCLKGKTYCLVLVKDFNIPENYYSLDSEVLALTRVLKVLELGNGSILDIGRRKTVYVEVKDGQLNFYRVIMKGGNYITSQLVKEMNIPADKVREILTKEGVTRKEVKKILESLLSSIGKEIQEPVVLSGGVSRLRGLKEMFKVKDNPFCEPEYTVAFGASLKHAVDDCSPSFRQEEVSPKDIKVFLGSTLLSFLLVGTSTYMIDLAQKEFIEGIRQKEKEEFKKYFPQKPAVAVRDQVKTLLTKERYPLTKKLLQLSLKLKEGISIYQFEYRDLKLKVRGDAEKEELLKDLNLKSIKRSPEGKYEFEMDL